MATSTGGIVEGGHGWLLGLQYLEREKVDVIPLDWIYLLCWNFDADCREPETRDVRWKRSLHFNRSKDLVTFVL